MAAGEYQQGSPQPGSPQPGSPQSQYHHQHQPYPGQSFPMEPVPTSGPQPVHYAQHPQHPQQPPMMAAPPPVMMMAGAPAQMMAAGGNGMAVMSTPYRSLQSASQPVWCPGCRAVVQTVTNFEAGNFAHALAVGLCWVTCCCCWIPYVFNGVQDVVHKCPNCSVVFATFHRSGRTEVHVPENVSVQQPMPMQPMPMQPMQPMHQPMHHQPMHQHMQGQPQQ